MRVGNAKAMNQQAGPRVRKILAGSATDEYQMLATRIEMRQRCAGQKHQQCGQSDLSAITRVSYGLDPCDDVFVRAEGVGRSRVPRCTKVRWLHAVTSYDRCRKGT